MKTIQLIISVAAVLAVSACGKQAEVAETAPANKVESQNVQLPVPQSAPQGVKAQSSHIQEFTAPASSEANKPPKQIAGNSKPAPKTETTEQALNSVIPNRQEPVNSQVAQQKQRGKKAEDEMLMETMGK